MTGDADLAARRLRIPKLTYRNPNPQPVHPADTYSTITITDAANNEAFAVQRPSISTTDSAEPSSRSRLSTSSSVSSLASSNESSSAASKASAKKKKNGLLSFLTVKEPSQLALEQFAKSQRQQAATKSSPASPARLQSNSLQKLPTNVPKVNSKWDGIPGTKPSRHSMASSKRSSSSSHGGIPMHGFDSSSTYSVASDASHGPPPSLTSAIDLTGHVRSKSSPSSSSQSPSSPLEMSRFFPDDSTTMSGALPASPHPWSPPPAPPQIEAQDAFPFPEKTRTDDPVDENMNVKADAIFKRLKGARGFMPGEVKEVNIDEEPDKKKDVPDTHGFLFDFPTSAESQTLSMSSSTSSSPSSITLTHPTSTPPPARIPQPLDRPARPTPHSFSRPRPVRIGSSRSGTSSTLPTLYEVSIVSTETITELSKPTTADTRNSLDTVSLADSVTPSEMSASWHHSPKDRLGLGGRISKGEAALPWENWTGDQAESGKPKKGRLSLFRKSS